MPAPRDLNLLVNVRFWPEASAGKCVALFFGSTAFRADLLGDNCKGLLERSRELLAFVFVVAMGDRGKQFAPRVEQNCRVRVC